MNDRSGRDPHRSRPLPTTAIHHLLVSLLPDHLLAPALKRWLPRLLEGGRAACWWPETFPPPRRLRKLVAELAPLSERSVDIVVIVSPLLAEVPAEVVRPGQRLVELGTLVPLPALSRLRPWKRRQAAAAQAAERFARWVEAGLMGGEQWVSLDPDDTVVTLGTMGHRVAA